MLWEVLLFESARGGPASVTHTVPGFLEGSCSGESSSSGRPRSYGPQNCGPAGRRPVPPLERTAVAAKYLVFAVYRKAVAVGAAPVLPDAVSASARLEAMRTHPSSFRPTAAQRPPLRLVS